MAPSLAGLAAALALLAAVARRAIARSKSPTAVPQSDFDLDYEGGAAAANVLRAVAILMPAFPVDRAAVTQIQGGITNLLWKVAGPEGSVLVRVYGENTEAMFDRAKETALFGELSSRAFGPRLLGLFRNGRIEGYFESSRNLEHYEMGQTSPIDFPVLISHQLARMHAISDLAVPKSPRIWEVLDKWLAMARAVSFPEDAAKQKILNDFDLAGFACELEWLKTVLPSPVNNHGAAWIASNRALRLALEPVFCHNDALSGNVLYLDKEKRAQLIDFEYGGYNYRSFDLANHWCEHCGFEFLMQYYPPSSIRRHFLTSYCASSGIVPPLSEEELEVFEQWTNRFSLCAHAMWFLWAVLQARYSVIPVDFLDYARKRRQGFFVHRGEFF